VITHHHQRGSTNNAIFVFDRSNDGIAASNDDDATTTTDAATTPVLFITNILRMVDIIIQVTTLWKRKSRDNARGIIVLSIENGNVGWY
jgi:hypothetical protein